MSTKFYSKKHLFARNFIKKFFLLPSKAFILIALANFFVVKNSFAWAGYEESTNIAIDIPPGNLVRVGREIDIFDFGDNKYHPCEVIFMEDIFSGSRLEVKDIETGKRRIFYMER